MFGYTLFGYSFDYGRVLEFCADNGPVIVAVAAIATVAAVVVPIVLHRRTQRAARIAAEKARACQSETPPRPPQQATPPPLLPNPPAHNPYFTGREDLLARLHGALSAGGTTAITQAHAITGLGGVGKTQLAVEYAHRHADEYRHVLWVGAGTETDILSAYTRIAAALSLVPDGTRDTEAIRDAVKAWLDGNGGWLLVFDNADEPDILAPFLPTRPKGHVLVTSRAQTFGALNIRDVLPVDVLPEKEAIKFLFDRTRCDRADSAEQAAAGQLARELGCLPLALEQAGAYIEANASTLRRYLQSYRALRLDLLDEERPEITGRYPLPVTKTWQMNFEAVEEEAPATADLLRFASFLAPDAIPYELVTDGARELGERLAQALEGADKVPARLDRLLGALRRYSLVACNPADQSFSVHQLVQEVTKWRMGDDDRRTWAERTVRAADAAFPAPEFENWRECDRLLPHAQAACELVIARGIESAEAGTLLNQTAYRLDDRAQCAEAEPLYRRALEIKEKVLGPEHPSTATSLNNLAALCRAQGRYAEAEPLFRRALEIREKVLGPEHPDTAGSLNNLAGLYYAQGRYAEAEPLFRRALEIAEKALGPEHPSTAGGLNNLALLYDDQGRYAEAEPLYRRALEIFEKVLGPQHLYTATSLNNLAALYYAQGRYAEAEPLYRRALAIKEKALGPEHPSTATSVGNLAALYRAQDRYAEAEPLYRRALAIKEKALGPEHPSTATATENYAVLLRHLDRDEEAAALDARAAEIRRKHAEQEEEARKGAGGGTAPQAGK